MYIRTLLQYRNWEMYLLTSQPWYFVFKSDKQTREVGSLVVLPQKWCIQVSVFGRIFSATCRRLKLFQMTESIWTVSTGTILWHGIIWWIGPLYDDLLCRKTTSVPKVFLDESQGIIWWHKLLVFDWQADDSYIFYQDRSNNTLVEIAPAQQSLRQLTKALLPK